ncbi:hypothetical protein M9194_18805 [Vibrio sp. S4M6]|uniref:hypothetical protein n=1 Tax=Vibrio sinus TaxID=2946865 RepID=UPI002029D790|nr:hypothetical protein [Vibrio sinus]MCL9783481.1 hypothetical protein [Vibrio sinus]
MQQTLFPRIFSRDINDAISEQTLVEVESRSQSVVESFGELPDKQKCFILEKITLACDSIQFLFNQKLRLYLAGYPSNDSAYLNQVERQLSDLQQVLIAFYAYHPGSILHLLDSKPDVVACLALSTGLDTDLFNPALLGLVALSKVKETKLAKMLAVQTKTKTFDGLLASLISCSCKNAQEFFDYMMVRNTVSSELLKHWLRKGILDSHVAMPILALRSDDSSQQWLLEHYAENDLYFERSLIADNPRVCFANILASSDMKSVKQCDIYACFWPSHLPPVWEPSHPTAPIQLMLSGNPEWVPEAIEQMSLSESYRDWLQALSIVYGPTLPIDSNQNELELNRDQTIDQLLEWVDSGLYKSATALRLGSTLSLETSIKALQSSRIDDQCRFWIWRQICVCSRVYFHWDALQLEAQQASVFAHLLQPSATGKVCNWESL